MLASATVLLSIAAISSWSLRPRAPAGTAAGALAAWASVARWGWIEGLASLLVVAMACASVLVLVLSPRMRWARPLALTSGGLGAVACVWGLLS